MKNCQAFSSNKWSESKVMNYEIRHFDTPLLRFSAAEDSSTHEIEILWRNTEKISLLLLNITIIDEKVANGWSIGYPQEQSLCA